MEIFDDIYGQIVLTDPLVIKLIQTKIFQRLKGLSQNGLYGMKVVAFDNQGHYSTRYEHSIGTAYICQLLGASEEIQIQALLHDLYHTNFSHDVDYLYDETKSFHETNKSIFFTNITGIDELIHVLGEQRFHDLMSLNSNLVKSKRLGADNLDYILRDGFYNHLVSLEWIRSFLREIVIQHDQICIKNTQMCHDMIELSRKLDCDVYNSARNKGINILTSRVLRLAIEKSLISEKQLFYGYDTDQSIWTQIVSVGDPEIECLVNLINNTAFYYGPMSQNQDIGFKTYRIRTNIQLRHRILSPPLIDEAGKIFDISSPNDCNIDIIYHLCGMVM